MIEDWLGDLRWIGDFYRSLLFAPFGGEPRLVSSAAARSSLPEPRVRVYAGRGELSTETGAFRFHGSVPLSPKSSTLLAVSFLFAYDAEHRRQILRDLDQALVPGGTLVVLDHNAPRPRWMRWLAVAFLALGWPLAPSVAPAARLVHPAAQELQKLGFEIVSLRLLAGELFQAVVARRPAA